MNKTFITSSTMNAQGTNRQSSNQSDMNVTNVHIATAKVTVDSRSQAFVQLPQLSSPLVTQLSIKQVALLNQSSTLALLTTGTTQQALLFLQSQLRHIKLTLTPDIAKLALTWLSQSKHTSSGKHSFSKMPPLFATLLSEKTGLTLAELPQNIHSAKLKMNVLELSFLQGEPIVQLKSARTTTSISAEQLQQTLQMLIPLSLDKNDTLLIKQDDEDSSDHASESDELSNSFNLTFNLDSLGQLIINVVLNEFELSTTCLYSNIALEQKVKRFWPQLTDRLEKLGFTIENKFQLTPKLEQKEKTKISAAIIDTNV